MITVLRLRSLGLIPLLTIALPSAAHADDIAPGAKLGTVQFDAPGTPAAQAQVERAVKLLHHMMYSEADAGFATAAAADPNCAFAWWGRAMTRLQPLWPEPPTEAERRVGAQYLQRGLALASLTPRERAYLETMLLYFGAADVSDFPARLKELDRAWTALAARFPDDLDAQAFSALYHLAPARFLPKDRSHRLQLEAARRLERVLARIPDHPGAQHYKIHAYDFPLLADRALEICDAYGNVAPEVPHALHMPSHIYTRRGWWEKSADFNRRAADAAKRLALAEKTLNSHYPHALDYLAYAYLQLGKFRDAAAVRDELAKLTGPFSSTQRAAMGFAYAAVPARCALERQAWSEAAALPLRQPATFPWGPDFIYCDSIVVFARALGMARTGQDAAALEQLAALEAIHRDLAASRKPPYWAAQAQVQSLVVRGWLERSNGAPESAERLLRQAVELETATDKEAVTPGEVLPAGDLLGEFLHERERYAEALAAYEAVLQGSPNRLNTLYGAGLAAEKAGRAGKAREHFGQLVSVAAGADPGNPRVEYARNYVADPARR